MKTYQITITHGESELVFTDEGFRDLSFDGFTYDSIFDAYEDFASIDADWLRMDGFDAPEFWVLNVEQTDDETGEIRIMRRKAFRVETEAA